MTAEWSSQTTVVDAVRRLWDRGVLLRALAGVEADAARFPLRVRLVGPTRDEIGGAFGEAAAWARQIQDVARREPWTLRTRRVRVGTAGVQVLPTAAEVASPQQALELLGDWARAQAEQHAKALATARVLHRGAERVALTRPLEVIEAGDDFALLLEIAMWLLGNPRPNLYPRQIPVSGAHTKFIEENRALLTRLLDAMLLPEAVDPTARTFAGRYGLRAPARRVRVRANAEILGVPSGDIADVEWDVVALAALIPARWLISEVVVVENKTSFLTMPVSAGRLVLWGEGYGADDLLGSLPWLSSVRVVYWGDIDTHGFVILDRVRIAAPHTESVLMDAETLLAHKPFWATEPIPRVEALSALTENEASLYGALCEGVYGDRVRLEQELIRFDLVEAAFHKRVEGGH